MDSQEKKRSEPIQRKRINSNSPYASQIKIQTKLVTVKDHIIRTNKHKLHNVSSLNHRGSKILDNSLYNSSSDTISLSFASSNPLFSTSLTPTKPYFEHNDFKQFSVIEGKLKNQIFLIGCNISKESCALRRKICFEAIDEIILLFQPLSSLLRQIKDGLSNSFLNDESDKDPTKHQNQQDLKGEETIEQLKKEKNKLIKKLNTLSIDNINLNKEIETLKEQIKNLNKELDDYKLQEANNLAFGSVLEEAMKKSEIIKELRLQNQEYEEREIRTLKLLEVLKEEGIPVEEMLQQWDVLKSKSQPTPKRNDHRVPLLRVHTCLEIPAPGVKEINPHTE